jgi:hypothetical protein
MIEVNKPIDTAPNVRCYKCKTEFYVHPMAAMDAPFITDCELHKSSCKHESDGVMYNYHLVNIDGVMHETKCKKCGEFYR